MASSHLSLFGLFILLSPTQCAPNDHALVDGLRRWLTDREARIVGGTKATAFAYPFVVSLQQKCDAAAVEAGSCTQAESGTFTHQCGGALISGSWILTAAHCFASPPVAANWRAALHRQDIRLAAADDHACSEDVGIASIITHPNYVGGQQIVNDIALLQLSTPAGCAASNPVRQPVSIP